MEFSSTIRVAELNDYIAPSQDCVVALNGKLKADQVRSAAGILAASLLLSPTLHPFPSENCMSSWPNPMVPP